MPCKIEIKKNLVSKVEEMSSTGLGKPLTEATNIAREVNISFGTRVVEFVTDGDVIERIIDIPNTLVDRYFDNENALEHQESYERSLEGNQFDFEGELYATAEDMPLYKNRGQQISILDNRSEGEQVRITQLVVPKMVELANLLGIKIQSLEFLYAKQQDINRLQAIITNGKDVTATQRSILEGQIKDLQNEGVMADTLALADTMNRLIQFSNGYLSEDNLTEEVMHFVVDILEQKEPALFSSLYDKITQFSTYTEVKQEYSADPEYQTAEGKPDFYKLRKEAIGKLLAEYVLNPMYQAPKEQANFVASAWERIVKFVKKLFGTVDPLYTDDFKDVADRLLNDPAFIDKEDAEYFSGGAYKARRAKGINRVLSETARELEDDVEYQAMMPAYAKKGIRPTYKDAEEMWKYLESFRGDTSIEEVKIDEAEDGTPVYDDRYKYKGVTLPERVSTVIAMAINKAKAYANVSGTSDAQLLREAKMDEGKNVHKDIQNIVNAHVDPSTGLLRDVPLEITEVNTVLEVFEILEKAVILRLKWYEDNHPGTRFSVELPVINWREGYAGTIDFLAVLPDGQVDILDWKTTEIFQRGQSLEDILKGTPATGNVSPFNQKSWQIQVDLYKRALYRLGVNKFRLTRAIPISTSFTSFPKDKTKPITEPGNRDIVLTDIKISGTNMARIPQSANFLIPVSTKSETTGVEALDNLVSNLWKHYNRMESSRRIGDQSIKHTELESMRNAIRELQVRRTANSMVTVFSSYLNRFEKLADSTLEVLAKMEKGQRFVDEETGQELEELIQAMREAIDFLDTFHGFATTIRNVYPKTPSEAESMVLGGVDNIQFRTEDLSKRLENNLLQIVGSLGESVDLEKLGDPQYMDLDKSRWNRVFTNLFSHQTQSLALFGRLKATVDVIRRIRKEKLAKRHKQLLDALEGWVNAKGITKAAALAMIRKKGTTRLIDIIKSEFWEELAKKKDEMTSFREELAKKHKSLAEVNKEYARTLLPWIKENMDYEKVRELYEKAKERYEDWLDSESFFEDELIDQRKKDDLLAQWERRNNIFVYPEALSTKDKPFQIIRANPEKWTTDEYKNLQTGHEPLKALLDFYTEMNITAAKEGMMDDIYRPSTFIPLTEKSTLGYRLKKSLGHKIASLKFAYNYVGSLLKNKEGLAEDGFEIEDESSNRVRYIPVYYKHLGQGLQEEEDFTYSFARWIDHITDYGAIREFENRLTLATFVERTKAKLIKTTFSGKPVRKASDPTQFETVDNTGETLSLLEKYIDTYVYNSNPIEPDTIFKQIVNAIMAYTTTLYLGLNIPAMAGNILGGGTRRVAVTKGWMTEGDVASAQLLSSGVVTPDVSSKTNGVEEVRQKDLFLKHFFQTTMSNDIRYRDYKEFGKDRKFSGALRSFSDFALWGYGFGDRVVLEPVSSGLFFNMTIIDGKVVHIPSYVKSLYPTRHEGTPEEQEKIAKEIEEKVVELRKKNLYTLVKGKEGDYTVEGIDSETTKGKNEILYVSGMSKNLQKNVQGNMSSEDLSDAKMTYWLNVLMKFKNWMPWQLETYYSKVRIKDESRAAQVGRINAFANMLTHGAFTRMSSLLLYNVLPVISYATNKAGVTGNFATDESMARAGREIYMDYLKEQQAAEKPVELTEADFIDLYKSTVRGLMGELNVISTIFLIFAVSSLFMGGDDKKKWYYSLLMRMYFNAWNELTFAYNPNSVAYTGTHLIPPLSAISDTMDILIALRDEVLGFALANLGSGKVRRFGKKLRKNAHPLEKIVESIPVARQINDVLLQSDRDYQKFMEVKKPRRTW